MPLRSSSMNGVRTGRTVVKGVGHCPDPRVICEAHEVPELQGTVFDQQRLNASGSVVLSVRERFSNAHGSIPATVAEQQHNAIGQTWAQKTKRGGWYMP